ncbi:MAG: ABC transporter permease, partial [Lachnospiraceae bacterium]|nr:ABC transporter permease [Lachnospiraceae bacterium]
MSGFMYEVKKIMRCQRGLFYTALVFLLGTVWLAVSDSPTDNAMEQYKNEYDWYLEKVNGYCSDEASLYLEQEAVRIAKAKEKQSTLLENYYDGKISESEYKKENREIERVLEHQNGFEVIYQQYLYICENVGNRFFLQTNGWMGLLGKGTLNFILFSGILLLVTPVFCSEYSCQMDALLLTAREGRKSALYKLLIMIAVVLFLSLGISLIEYGFYRFKYGLPDGDYPIQSIRYFADCSKGISLLEGYVYIGLLRMFGGVFLTILLMLISVLAKRYAVTLLTGAASVIIPYIGLSKTGVYRLPLPLPFL